MGSESGRGNTVHSRWIVGRCAFCRVDKAHLIVYYTMRAIQSRGFPPNLFSYMIGVWPSGKAVDFGTHHRSHPFSFPSTASSLPSKRRNELPQIIQRQPRLRRDELYQSLHLPIVLINGNRWLQSHKVRLTPYPRPTRYSPCTGSTSPLSPNCIL